MDQYIGKLLDNRYEILERIGIGGMAVVYKGRDHRLNRLVAIKILKEELAQDAEFRRRFHDESQAVAMLSHPNIMAVYDVSHSAELDYIVMELLDGITLKQYMQKKGGKLAWREALHFITQIMKALSHAHSRGIIHRDIKPHNIMVLRDGSLKVADFGIARLTSAAQATLTQEALGSVHYISPEQARGSHIDARSDIYSAGVVLYEMITGRLPYEGDSPVAVAIQHINSIPLSPREIDPEIPEALEAITMKAMASDVNQRYISADAMLADLEEFRKNPSINFDYTPADLLISEGDEPTQILGANTPHTVRTQPAHGARSPEDTYVSPAPHPRKSRPARVEDDYDDYPERGGSRLPIILAIVAVAVFVAGIGVFLWVSFFGGAGETLYAVPSLLGKTLEEARADASVVSANFQIVEGGETDSDRPVGQIVSQDPVEGRNAAAGATITVILSNGSGYADEEARQMPDLVEQDVRLAVSSLAALGYSEEAGNLVIQKEYSEDIAKDHVISTVPTKDTDLTDVAQVTLVVSDGEETLPVTVISFLEMTEEDARTAATNLGLDPVFEGSEYSSEYDEGDVCWQSITNGTQVAEGTTIRFRVSLGPDPAATPSPSVEPSPEATPAPTPDDGEEELKPYTFNVSLPRDGRESVQVNVTVGDGQYSYSNTYDTIMQSIPITVYGSGTQEIRVYFDGELAETTTYDFD
ncbi:Stk1 family PASTA domain-containing Ser/Thr kinase [uncultured Flavonifractor sp.]|uniref:Stk1 family PASTA domain-containing Ser/Thr kinase n=1 Tax=uncultured Flavonifractor sp. TaxID=1193534 RepID=UPI0025E5D478|nr:Stk1 family PASTA domain-containing Ser/Thr kinase [uncultured Flavonifractor sp.]